MNFKTLIFTLLLSAFNLADIIKIPLKRQIVDSSLMNINGNIRFLQSSNSTNSTNTTKQNDPTSGYYVTELANYLKQQYAGEILVGDGKKSFTVAFDTGSNKLMLPSKSCIDQKKCKGFSKYYSCDSSDGCNTTDASDEQAYGKGKVIGNYVSAPVRISGLDPVNQSILLFDEEKDNSNQFSEGLFGLGMFDSKNNGSNSFIAGLFNKGLIKNNMFSIYLGFKIDDSEIVFGGYNTNNIAENAKIYTHKVVTNGKSDESQRWALSVKKFSLGDFSTSLNNQKNIAVINSGYSYLGIEKSIFDDLVENLKSKQGVEVKNDQYYINCNKTLPDMKFTMKDANDIEQVYNLPLAYYVNNSTSSCSLLIQPITTNDDVALIFGNLFFRRYLTIFSYQNQTIGFALSIADPKDDYTSGLPTWAIAIIAVAATLVSCVGGFLLYKKYKHKFQSNQLTQTLTNNQSTISSGVQKIQDYRNKKKENNKNDSTNNDSNSTNNESKNNQDEHNKGNSGNNNHSQNNNGNNNNFNNQYNGQSNNYNNNYNNYNNNQGYNQQNSSNYQVQQYHNNQNSNQQFNGQQNYQNQYNNGQQNYQYQSNYNGQQNYQYNNGQQNYYPPQYQAQNNPSHNIN